MTRWIPFLALFLVLTSLEAAYPQYSGIYPHLAFFNEEGECGTGAVVPWAGRLWVITYPPHKPLGSTDKLYEITPRLDMIIRPESVGGTHANRLVHRESGQLFIGPYVIDSERRVRVIPPAAMPGRLTGTARHLFAPAEKVYFATMEEGLYTVDVDTLEVEEHIRDGNNQAPVGNGIASSLPGYHGKGLYTGQGRLVYTNNGEIGQAARTDPSTPSGALAEWRGEGDWQMVRRDQFTEVSGPGGIYGNDNPDTDPLWAIGWDVRSLILMVLDKGTWHRYRLPKASHSYDGAHGWNTEWPRIREIGETDLLMTMHGMFWRFPPDFRPGQTGGLAPRSTYLKVIGDFCHWQERVVFGCDDTANREFLNTRRAKAEIPGPQSQSNLWFVDPEDLDRLGPPIGRGAVWLNDPVKAGAPSVPFLVNGFDRRSVHLYADSPAEWLLEYHHGDGRWRKLERLKVDGYRWYPIDPGLPAAWIRITSSKPLEKATAWFHLSGNDRRSVDPAPETFKGVARIGRDNPTGGLIRAMDGNTRKLQFAAAGPDGRLGYYLLDGDMNLSRQPSSEDAWQWMQEHVAVPPREGILIPDTASVLYVSDKGERFRLPLNADYGEAGPLGLRRLCREVATERDLFNCQGTFYDLPAKNAGGFSRIRPVSTHNRDIKDYCSYRGLLVLSGVDLAAAGDNPHIIRSDDGRAGLWVGALDDLWELGKPVGSGGPWKDTEVRAGEPSDPYLMTGYDRKSLELSSSRPARITAEVDITGEGDWHAYQTFSVEPDRPRSHTFPRAFSAYWIRFRSDSDTRATARLEYR